MFDLAEEISEELQIAQRGVESALEIIEKINAQFQKKLIDEFDWQAGGHEAVKSAICLRINFKISLLQHYYGLVVHFRTNPCVSIGFEN